VHGAHQRCPGPVMIHNMSTERQELRPSNRNTFFAWTPVQVSRESRVSRNTKQVTETSGCVLLSQHRRSRRPRHFWSASLAKKIRRAFSSSDFPYQQLVIAIENICTREVPIQGHVHDGTCRAARRLGFVSFRNASSNAYTSLRCKVQVSCAQSKSIHE